MSMSVGAGTRTGTRVLSIDSINYYVEAESCHQKTIECLAADAKLGYARLEVNAYLQSSSAM
jgi:hypothetical protein